jgi:hypothetical protein
MAVEGGEEQHDQGTPPRRPPGRPGLRISMSMSKLNSKRPNFLTDEHRQGDTSPQALGLPRFPPHMSADLHGDDPVRSSINSAMTCSSVEQTSGTERSSVMTKSSSVTDLSPDTPDGPYAPYEKDGGMSVEDAIAMYLDGFSDVPEEDIDEPERPDFIFKDGPDRASDLMEPNDGVDRPEVLTEDELDTASDPTEPDEETRRHSESLIEAMSTSMGRLNGDS